MSLAEAFVDIAVSPRGHRVRVVTRSTRGDAVARALSGMPVSSPAAPLLLSSLFALCPQAHCAAWNAAIATALGRRPDPGLAPRLAAESAAEHLRFLAFDAPNALGLAPDPELRRLGELRSLLAQEMAAEKPDLSLLRHRLERDCEHFITGCPPAGFAATGSLSEFESWLRGGATVAARLLSALWETVPCRGQFGVEPLRAADPREAAAWFGPEFSSQAPLIAGQARLTGAWARQLGHPLMTELSEQYGSTLRELYAARLLELLSLVVDWTEALPLLRAARLPDRGAISLVECARGLLIHRLRLSPDLKVVERADIVAPTEWNFAPGGAAERGLEAIEFYAEERYRREAAWVVTGLDACVPCRLTFAGAA